MDQLAAEFHRGGATAVNKKLEELFPEPLERVEKLLSMQATGKWEVVLHQSSDDPDEYDDGAVIGYAG